VKTLKSIALMIVCFGSVAHAGNEGHGGDGYAADFIRTGRLVHGWLSQNSSSVSAAEFLKALEGASIESTSERLFLDQVEKDAINYPAAKRVLFNREKWKDLTMERQRWQLVLHEVLGLMGKADGKYEISDPLMKAAFPGADVLASKYRGTMPSCLGFFDKTDGWMIPAQLSLVPGAKGFDAVYRILDPVTLKSKAEQVLARDLVCQYSNHHAGVMRCQNAAGDVFSLTKKTTLSLSPYGQQFDSADPYFYFIARVRSREVERLQAAGDFVEIPTYHPKATPVSDTLGAEIEKGKLPLFMHHLSYPQGVAYKTHGVKSLGGAFQYEVGASFCSFAYPTVAP
jgi:hypothetical protein